MTLWLQSRNMWSEIKVRTERAYHSPTLYTPIHHRIGCFTVDLGLFFSFHCCSAKPYIIHSVKDNTEVCASSCCSLCIVDEQIQFSQNFLIFTPRCKFSFGLQLVTMTDPPSDQIVKTPTSSIVLFLLHLSHHGTACPRVIFSWILLGLTSA